jgi:hypothetical protein
LLARYVLASAPGPTDRFRLNLAAAVAGLFYAFAGSKLFYVALGQFNIASSHWIPFAVLYILRAHRTPVRLKNAGLAGLFLTLQAWAELTYASFLLVFLGLYWAYRLLTHLNRASWWAFRPHLWINAITLLVFTAGISPILAQMLPDMLAEGDFMVKGDGFADAFSADLLGFFVPTMLHPWLGGLIRHTGLAAPGSITGFDKGQHIYLGFTLLALAAVALLTAPRCREVRFWALVAAVFALLALGPTIIFNGHSTGLPGPFGLLQHLPFFKGNRYPSRYSVMLLLSLSMLAGLALRQTEQKFKIKNLELKIQNSLPLLAAALFLFEHLSLPLPQSDMRVPQPYRLIAADPAPVAVLDIPFAWRNGFRITGAYTTGFMFGQFYQTTHQKKMVQGNTSRNPEFKFQYFTEAPVLNSLLALETGQTLPKSRWAADKAIAADVLAFFNIGYIVVRPEAVNPFGHFPQATIPYIEAVLPVDKIHADAALTLYRVRPAPPPARPVRVSGDALLVSLYLAEGWSRPAPGQPLAAQRRHVTMLLPLTAAAQQVSLRAGLPQTTPAAPQTVTLALNGWNSAPQPLTNAAQTLTFTIPAGVARPGLNRLTLRFAQLYPAPPALTVVSAGQPVGSFAHIFLNGRDVSPNRRGYNVAVISAQGDLLTAAAFDTHLNPQAGATLADFLAAVPADAVIAIAAADEASQSLSAEAVTALHALGATANPRACFRCSHALLVDPHTGVTSETLDPLRPVSLSLGPALTEPTVAALMEWFTVEPAGP